MLSVEKQKPKITSNLTTYTENLTLKTENLTLKTENQTQLSL